MKLLDVLSYTFIKKEQPLTPLDNIEAEHAISRSKLSQHANDGKLLKAPPRLLSEFQAKAFAPLLRGRVDELLSFATAL